jgi:hypothetical protein
MVLAPLEGTVLVPPPAYQRAPRRRRPVLCLDALTVVTRLHLLALCRLTVQIARHRCPPLLPAGSGGRPRRYNEESLLLLALLRTLWRLSYQNLHDWLVAWPALAVPLDSQSLLKDAPRCPAPPSHAAALVVVGMAAQ